MALRAPYDADKLPDWVLGALPYGVLYPKVYGNVASLVLQGTVSRQKSVNLISEEWNHKMVSWVGSVATQSQMEQQTIVQGNTGAIHEPTR